MVNGMRTFTGQYFPAKPLAVCVSIFFTSTLCKMMSWHHNGCSKILVGGEIDWRYFVSGDYNCAQKREEGRTVKLHQPYEIWSTKTITLMTLFTVSIPCNHQILKCLSNWIKLPVQYQIFKNLPSSLHWIISLSNCSFLYNGAYPIVLCFIFVTS